MAEYWALGVRPWRMTMIVVVVAVMLALAATLFGWKLSVRSDLVSMRNQLALIGSQVENVTVNSDVMSTASMLGKYNAPIKKLALGELPPDSSEVTSRLKAVVDQYNASNAFVMDREGVIVAYVRQKGQSGLGKKLSFRPYFKQAIAGQPNVYAAVGSNSGKRGLYFAAPVYSTERDMVWTDVIGIVAIKLDLSVVDSMFSQFSSPVMLLSPQGVVFSSNRPDWLFTVTGEISSRRIGAIRDMKQFGKVFNELSPTSLPIDVGNDSAKIEGKHYIVGETPIDWNDPLGPWRLIMLKKFPGLISLETIVTYGGGTLIACFALGFGLFFKLKNEYNKRRFTEKLVYTNKRLVEAMRAKADVDRIMRHDLKNPLTVIMTNPFILKNSQTIGPMELDMLEQIEVAGYTMLNMINSSLDMYKIEKGTYEAKLVSFDLARSMRIPLKQFSTLAEESGVDLEIRMDGQSYDGNSVCHVIGVELLCYTALSNLIRNALEASGMGDTVSVSFETGEVCSVRISNQAVVPDELRETFFEKYATANKEGGTGLGTYSAKLFIEAVGGTVGMETDIENGTTVNVTIPMKTTS